MQEVKTVMPDLTSLPYDQRVVDERVPQLDEDEDGDFENDQEEYYDPDDYEEDDYQEEPQEEVEVTWDKKKRGVNPLFLAWLANKLSRGLFVIIYHGVRT